MKISLFLLYFRIFSRIRRTRLLIYFGIGINAVFYAVSFALILYFCGPGPGHNLIESFNDHHCVVQARTLGTIQASFNIASDIYLLCIPMPVISNLQLSRKKKIGVSAMFMTGSLSVILPSKVVLKMLSAVQGCYMQHLKSLLSRFERPHTRFYVGNHSCVYHIVSISPLAPEAERLQFQRGRDQRWHHVRLLSSATSNHPQRRISPRFQQILTNQSL